MVQQCRRQRIDEMRVVDRHDERATGCASLESRPDSPKEVDRCGRGRRVRRQQRRDHSEREPLCGPGRDEHLGDGIVRQVTQHLLDDARLARARRGDDHDTATLVERARGGTSKAPRPAP